MAVNTATPAYDDRHVAKTFANSDRGSPITGGRIIPATQRAFLQIGPIGMRGRPAYYTALRPGYCRKFNDKKCFVLHSSVDGDGQDRFSTTTSHDLPETGRSRPRESTG